MEKEMDDMSKDISITSDETYQCLLRYFLSKYLLPLCGFTDEIINIIIIISFSNNFQIESYCFPFITISEESSSSTIINYNKRRCMTLNNLCFQKDNDIERELFCKTLAQFFELIQCNLSSIPNDFWFPHNYNSNSNNDLNLTKEKSFKKSIYYQSLYKMAVERGICWLISKQQKGSDFGKIEELIHILEEWSLKTYEGHKVCYGILINQGESKAHIKESDDYCQSFLDFLKDEYSAVLSDGFSSLLKIDRDCNFEEYVSITNDNELEKGKISDSYLPYRFF